MGKKKPTQSSTAAVPPSALAFYCGNVETLADSFKAARWPTDSIKVHLDTSGYSGPLDHQKLRDGFMEGCLSWTDWLLFNIEWTDNPREANILAVFGPIDRPGGVLAWSELCGGTMAQLAQRYDKLEQWVIVLSFQPPQRGILWPAVVSHEVGHAMGMVHDAANAPALMAPMYTEQITSPTPRDIDRMVLLGYARRPIVDPVDPPPPPPPPPPGGGTVYKELLKKGINLVFDYLDSQVTNKPLLAALSRACRQMALSYIDSLDLMVSTIGGPVTRDLFAQIVSMIFAMLKGKFAGLSEFEAGVDELHAAALANADGVVAQLRTENLIAA